VLNKKQIQELFKRLEEKHGQPPEDIRPKDLDENVEPSLSVYGIQSLIDEFDLPLETVRKLTLRQYFWLSMECDEKNSEKEIPFEVEEKADEFIAEMQKAGGMIAYLEQRRKKKIPLQPSPLLTKQKYR